MRSSGREDEIRLVLPAQAGYSRVARVATSGLAVRLGLAWAEVEDLRLAVDETLIFLLRPDTTEGNVTLTYSISDDRLRIDASGAMTADGRDHQDDAEARSRFEQIVGPLVDEHEVADVEDDVEPGGRTRHVQLTKRLAT